MASTSETGHAKNAATFENLISFCTGYGAAYNPSKATLKLPALATQLTTVNAALQAVKAAKTNYDNATNAREILFKPLKKFTTRIINGLSATDASPQTVDDAKSALNKIQGRRTRLAGKVVPVVKVTGQETGVLPAKGQPPAPEPIRTSSTSQQSFDKTIDHFAQLITTLAAEPKYAPNENELKVTTLNTQLADMKAKNTAVINANTALSNARIARDKALYSEVTGVVDTAQDIKQYVKSLFGTSSPQFKQISSLQFNRVKGD